MSRTRQIKRAYGEGKQAIIEAAIRLVAREGLAKLTYRSLALEAHITTGAVQHHFKSMDEVVEQTLKYVQQDAQNFNGTFHTLDEFISMVTLMMQEQPEMQIFWIEALSAARLNPTLSLLVEQQQDFYRRLTEITLNDLKIPYDDDLIDFIVSAFDGLVFNAVILGKTQPSRIQTQFAIMKRVIANYAILPR